jgi:hypothetical protein
MTNPWYTVFFEQQNYSVNYKIPLLKSSEVNSGISVELKINFLKTCSVSVIRVDINIDMDDWRNSRYSKH